MMTINNAVSSADIDRISDQGIAWANVDTGSTGLITIIRENEMDSRLCRVFTTRRESYEGVELFNGETCLGSKGNWLMQRLEPV